MGGVEQNGAEQCLTPTTVLSSYHPHLRLLHLQCRMIMYMNYIQSIA